MISHKGHKIHCLGSTCRGGQDDMYLFCAQSTIGKESILEIWQSSFAYFAAC